MIGLDLDNTMACYDQVFGDLAAEQGLLPPDLPHTKTAVRDHLRASGRESAWTALQGLVYGQAMARVPAFAGVVDCLRALRAAGLCVAVISHRTRQPYAGPPADLHGAARDWLARQGLLELLPGGVWLETTREAKLQRIAACGCTTFVDDLPELLGDAAFPTGVRRILFDPHGTAGLPAGVERLTAWADLPALLHGSSGADPPPALLAWLAETLPAPVVATRLRGGRNNRVWRLDGGPAPLLLKEYHRHPGDPRDRLAHEYGFLSVAAAAGLPQVARPVAQHRPLGAAVYTWLDGRPLRPAEITAERVAAAADWLRQVQALGPQAAHLPAASEAAFSRAEHATLVDRRLQRLLAEVTAPRVRTFVETHLQAAWQRLRPVLAALPEQPLPVAERWLSPSDCGFHNALWQPAGELAWLDFEYAGWDDVAKLVGDFYCQPDLPVADAGYDDFAASLCAALPDPARHLARCRAVWPLVRLRWACTMLNSYLPASAARRQFAAAEPDLERDLALAAAYLAGL
ncbi:MAG: aminoglycoside phosphotransferase family protein [Fimbriimonadaceae bacterium]|nr:aminoglycoside phosphotransferase family protein [Fimbriimonadaceae bacterium]